jgi:hypothetical protein
MANDPAVVPRHGNVNPVRLEASGIVPRINHNMGVLDARRAGRRHSRMEPGGCPRGTFSGPWSPRSRMCGILCHNQHGPHH